MKPEKTCAVCGTSYRSYKKDSRYCSSACQHESMRLPMRMCSHCGEDYRPKRGDRTSYCSKKCHGAARTLSARMKPKPSKPVQVAECATCGQAFEKSGSARYCSKACRYQTALASSRKRHEERSRAEYDPEAHRFECRQCGKEVVPEYGFRRTSYCSDACSEAAKREQKKATNKVRRARIRGVRTESFRPIDVLRRDKWTCQLCGTKTPKRLRGTTDDRAPELDHIVPLALGGAHTIENTQCLCRKCNIQKGASSAGQLALHLVA